MKKICKPLICIALATSALFAQVAQAAPYDDFFNAIASDKESVMVNLIFRGFDVNVRDPKGRPGLYLAAAEGSFKVAKVLLDWDKTDVNLLTPQDESPLMMAALKGHTALAKRIIERGGDVNKTGWTPLHYAATSAAPGHIEIIKLLLEENAYIDAESPNGSTPLMMAAMYGTADAAKLLMEEGADPMLKNEKGLTAIDFAQIAKRDEVAQAIGKTIRLKEPGLAPASVNATAAKPAPKPVAAKEPAKLPVEPALQLKPEAEIKSNFQFESQLPSK